MAIKAEGPENRLDFEQRGIGKEEVVSLLNWAGFQFFGLRSDISVIFILAIRLVPRYLVYTC